MATSLGWTPFVRWEKYNTKNVEHKIFHCNRNRYSNLFFCFRSSYLDYDCWILNFFSLLVIFFVGFVSILFFFFFFCSFFLFFLVLGDKLEVCYGEKRTSRGTSDIQERDKRKQNTHAMVGDT
jgi:hypothetical protein